MKKKKIIVAIVIAVIVIAGVGVAANFLGINHKHSFGEWETQTPATCENAEVEVRKCKCGNEETREGDPAIGHTFTAISAECLMEKPMDQITVTASDLSVTGTCENCGEAEITDGIEIEGGKLVLGENSITVKYGELSTTLIIWAEELDIALDGIVSDDTYVSSSKKDNENSSKKEMGTKSDINRLYYRVNIKDILDGELFADNKENAKVKLILAITEGMVTDETTFTLKAYNPETVGSDIDFANLTWNSVDNEKGAYSQLHWKNGTELVSDGVGYNVSVEHGYLNIMLAYSQIKDFVDKDGNIILVFGSNTAGLKVAALESKTVTNRPMFQVVLNDEHFHVFDQEVASGKYLVSAECKKKAQYYKSCVCGVAGTEIFKSSEVTQHSPVSITAESGLVSPLAGMVVEASDLSVTGTCVCGKQISITDGIELENAALAYGENQITVKYGKLTTKVTINVTEKGTLLGGNISEDTYVSSSSAEDKASDHSQEKEMGTNYTAARTYFRVNVSDVLVNEQFLKNKDNARAQFIFAVMDGEVADDTIFTLKAYDPNVAATNVAFSELTWNSVDKTNGTYSQLHWSNGTEILSDGVGYNVSVSNDGKYITITLGYSQIEEFVDSDGNILFAFATNTSGLKVGSIEYKKQTNRPLFRVVYNNEHFHVYDQEVAAEKYLVSANCGEKAKYKMSCACGEAGTETFKYGDKIKHTPVSITAESGLVSPLAGMVVQASDFTVTGTCKCGEKMDITEGITLEQDGAEVANVTLASGDNKITVKYGALSTEVTIKVTQEGTSLGGKISEDTYIASDKQYKDSSYSDRVELGANSSAFRTYLRVNVSDVLVNEQFLNNKGNARAQFVFAVTSDTDLANTKYTLKVYDPNEGGTDVAFSELTWNSVDATNGTYKELNWSNRKVLVSDGVGHNVSVSDDGKYITITLAYSQIEKYVDDNGDILFAFATNTSGLKIGSLENKTATNRPAFRVVYNEEHFHVYNWKEPVDAQCEVGGKIGYYYCSGCNGRFIDENGEKVKVDKTYCEIPATGHTFTSISATSNQGADGTMTTTEVMTKDITVKGTSCKNCDAVNIEISNGFTLMQGENEVESVTLALGKNTITVKYDELSADVTINVTEFVLNGSISDDTYVSSSNKDSENTTKKEMGTKSDINRLYYRVNISDILDSELFTEYEANAKVQLVLAITSGEVKADTTYTLKVYDPDKGGTDVDFSNLTWDSVNNKESSVGEYSVLHWENGTELVSDGVGHNVSVSDDGEYITITLAYSQIKNYVDADGNILFAFATNTSGLKVGSLENGTKSHRPVFKAILNDEHFCVFDQEVAEDNYLVSANCEEKAKYYKSCTCGEKGNDTFEDGEVIQHTYDTISTIYISEEKLKVGETVTAEDITVAMACVKCHEAVTITEGITLEKDGKDVDSVTLEAGDNSFFVKVKYDGDLRSEYTITVDEESNTEPEVETKTVTVAGAIVDDTYVDSSSENKEKDFSESKVELNARKKGNTIYRSYFRFNFNEVLDEENFEGNEGNATVQFTFTISSGSIPDDATFTLKTFNLDAYDNTVDFSSINWNSVKNNGLDSGDGKGVVLLDEQSIDNNIVTCTSNQAGGKITITLNYNDIKQYIDSNGNVIFALTSTSTDLKIASMEKNESDDPVVSVTYTYTYTKES